MSVLTHLVVLQACTISIFHRGLTQCTSIAAFSPDEKCDDSFQEPGTQMTSVQHPIKLNQSLQVCLWPPQFLSLQLFTHYSALLCASLGGDVRGLSSCVQCPEQGVSKGTPLLSLSSFPGQVGGGHSSMWPGQMSLPQLDLGERRLRRSSWVWTSLLLHV